MKCIVDNQLPAALARALAAVGHDAVHVQDVELGQASDHTIWQQAARQQRVVISKDEDFFYLANRPDDPGRLLWLRIGNTRKDELLSFLLPRIDEIDALFTEGQKIVEVRA